MANTLGGYELIHFAQDALMYLEKLLGMGARVHRGYDPNAQQKGKTIRIPAPGDFSVQDAPSSVQDIDGGQVDVTLDNWREVKFAVPDDEAHFTRENFMESHVQPAVFRLAEDVNDKLTALYDDIPWEVDYDESNVKDSLLAAREKLRFNGVPLDGRVHQAMSTSLEADVMAQSFVSDADTGGTSGENVLVEGSSFRRFGVNYFANSQIKTHTSGTVLSAGNDTIAAINNAGGYSAGATSMDVDGLNGSETLVVGDTFTIAGHDQRYVVTEDATASTGAITGLKFAPGLESSVADNDAVTFDDGNTSGVHADSNKANPLFHRNAFALATAPMQDEAGSEQARRQGIQVETVSNDNITLRSRMWYDPDNSRNIMAFDVLYGVKTLDRNMAVRLREDV